MKLQTLKAEVKQVLTISLFFYVCFVLFQLLKKAFLAEYDIVYYTFGKAFVGALVMGKVVALMDKLSLVKTFDHLPKIISVFFRSSLYLLAYLVFSFFEITIKHLIHGEAFSRAFASCIEEIGSKLYWIEMFVYLVAFLLFSCFWVIRNEIGPKQLYAIFFKSQKSDA